jgi:L-alanine-DL-glutamate epimerase-like enolase superfamily enzyme
LHISRIEVRALNVPLRAPFTIASSRLEGIANAAIKLELGDGSVGWGETPTLPRVTVEDQATATRVLQQTASALIGREAGAWRLIAYELAEQIPGYAAARAGLEMALIDALCRSLKIPLFHFFGGCQRELVTDITIPICAAADAERLAADYRAAGFATLKTKVGRDLAQDIERVRAIWRGHPHCRLVLDANEGYEPEQALVLLRELRRCGIKTALLEQPVAREDWDGLGRLAREAGVPVAADESCRSAQDALRIARDSLAQVINIKLAKCGVVEALAIAAIAKAAGIGLMIGGMVETRLAMGFSAHFAAGVGGFNWIDLDTPLLLAHDPVQGGYVATGPKYDLDVGAAGHGGSLDW